MLKVFKYKVCVMFVIVLIMCGIVWIMCGIVSGLELGCGTESKTGEQN